MSDVKPEWSTLAINDGDVIVWRTDDTDERPQFVLDLAEKLRTTDRRNCIIVRVGLHEDLSLLDEDDMRSQGWVRTDRGIAEAFTGQEQ
jgi:hypothetical protein